MERYQKLISKCKHLLRCSASARNSITMRIAYLTTLYFKVLHSCVRRENVESDSVLLENTGMAGSW